MDTPKQNKPRVAIVGAGITGLSAAYHLQQRGCDVILLERSQRVGGAIQTTHEDGYLAEHGPNSLMLADKRVDDFINAVGLKDEVVRASSFAKKRFVVHRSKLHALPHSILSAVTTPLFSFGAKLRMLCEPFIAKYDAKQNECFADFVTRRLGPEMLAKAAGPFVSGIYAGDPYKLSTKHAFPRLWNLEQNYGSFIKGAMKIGKDAKKGIGNPHRLAKREIVSFKNGMEALPNAIVAELNPGTVNLGSSINSIQQDKETGEWSLQWTSEDGGGTAEVFDHLILTCPAHILPKLPLDAKILEQISEVSQLNYPPVTSMLLGFKKDQITHPLDGFGMLMALTEKCKILGALFTSSLFDGRAPEGYVSINVMLGGARFPDNAQLSDDEMLSAVLTELQTLIGLTGKPTYERITRWKKAIPQLNLGYQNTLEQMEQCEQQYPGLHFAGNYRGGISVGDCMVSGIKLSDTI